jgi:hypothetical protein
MRQLSIVLLLIAAHFVELHGQQIALPKFGDRIGKLKRNFMTSTTTTTATTVTSSTLAPTFNDLNDDFNDIHRSDDYFSVAEHENKKYLVLKDQVDVRNETEGNKTLQINSPSSSLVQARLEMLTDFFDVPSPSMSSVYSTIIPRSGNHSRTGRTEIFFN